MKTHTRVAILIACLFTIAAGTGRNSSQFQPAEHQTLITDGTGPIQTCRPGTNCDPDDTVQIADGTGPIQTCRPGTNCGPDDTVQIADGTGPIQTCRPGTNCGPDDTLRLAISATGTFAKYTAA